MSNARSNILGRLHSGKKELFPTTEPTRIPLAHWDRQGRIDQFRRKMESVRAEVHVTPRTEWVNLLKRLVAEKQVANLLYAPDGPLGEALSQAWEAGASPLIARDGPLEQWKEELFFSVGGAITSTRWAIAETGTLVLWPTPAEPRSLSLVPPLHFAVLAEKDIYNTFAELVEKEQWQRGMPTNALLISGPSKTADIEQTLAYGVHGPVELIVIIIDDTGSAEPAPIRSR
ncbi:MAG: lactate utilization protein [Gammaproteobacteria bacterium]|nr:lactate utilization protein [Gammaproteobacteria bacterium]